MSISQPTEELIIPNPWSGSGSELRRPALIAMMVIAFIALIAALLYNLGAYGGATQPITMDEAIIGGETLQPPEVDPLAAPAAPDSEDAGEPESEPTLVPETPTATPEPTPLPEPTKVVEPSTPAEPQPGAESPGGETPPAPSQPEPVAEPAEPEPAEPAEPEPAEPEPAEPAEPEPAEPVDLDPIPVDNECHDVQIWERELFLQELVKLDDGVLSSTVTVMNCGPEVMYWKATTEPWVTLEATTGALDVGERMELGFMVNAAEVGTGDFQFPITVSTNTEILYSTVHGSLPLGGAANDCSTACITKAEVLPHNDSPDVTLDVESTVPAKFTVLVGRSGIVLGPDAQPSYETPTVVATSSEFATEFKTNIAGLFPERKYNIIVIAVDEDGNKWTESGQFTTTNNGGSAVN